MMTKHRTIIPSVIFDLRFGIPKVPGKKPERLIFELVL